jgi:hypothetical protein
MLLVTDNRTYITLGPDDEPFDYVKHPGGVCAVYHDGKYFDQEALNKTVVFKEPVSAVADAGDATDEFSLAGDT